jgi:hypothetical protein
MCQVEDTGQIAVEIDRDLAGRERQAVDHGAQDRGRLLAAVVGGVERVLQVGDVAAVKFRGVGVQRIAPRLARAS